LTSSIDNPALPRVAQYENGAGLRCPRHLFLPIPTPQLWKAQRRYGVLAGDTHPDAAFAVEPTDAVGVDVSAFGGCTHGWLAVESTAAVAVAVDIVGVSETGAAKGAALATTADR
jgi:hypothetical protein